ncbi:membrane protein, conserved [Thermococcus sp. 4557]|uniref:sodium-dependent transporter n=1 Tax=Thermococcus sp. (strain CGMCC 1.5172 / 4557) TaxID=1042877 RepID=UPI000219EF44|nr:sodium-dependent transporter [Thermococcus sp. 4557]AEK72514.1 membrane protein, conserved [Thermococcus sp. 4557]
MRKISFLMAFLIAGYVLGIWNFLVLPKYYITFGLKGFLISLLPMLVAMFLIYSEAESTKKTRYLIYELFFKISRTPALIFSLLMFLMIMLGVTTYYSSYGLALIFGMGSRYIPILAVGTILLSVLMLVMAKGRTLEFISVISILFVLFALASAFMIRNQALSMVTAPQAVQYMEGAVSSITSFDLPLTTRGVLFMVVSVFISLGLGAGVYYVLGSFTPEELDLRKVLAAVFVLQIILSFAAAFTVAYSLGAAYQAYGEAFQNPNIPADESMKLFMKFNDLKDYATNSDKSPMDSIEVFYSIPAVLRGNVPNDTTLIALLMLSLYLAGLTTIIILIEMGSQMLSEVMQLGRNQSLGFVGIIGMIVAGAMVVGDVRTMFVVVPFAVAALMAAVESYPLLSSELTHNKAVVSAVMLLLFASGLATLYYSLTAPKMPVKIGAVLGLVLLVPVLMNGMLLKARR